MKNFQQVIIMQQTKVIDPSEKFHHSLTKFSAIPQNPSTKTSPSSLTQTRSPISQTPSTKPSLLSDQNLYLLCKTYGSRALEWRRKFIGLLPEVNKRRLYEEKGFDSIFVFAYKLAGLSEKQVRRVLNLGEKFEGMPILQNLLINGEVSVNKLTRVASIANTENQEFLANQVQVLSKNAVETLVRDEKFVGEQDGVDKNQNGLFEPPIEAKSVPGHTSPRLVVRGGATNDLNLSPEVHQKLLELQQKGLDLNNLLLEFLQKRELEIAQKKEQIKEGGNGRI